MRIGCGIDCHRLIRDPGRPLMLGGVAIPSEWALEGHSDADCILHALTDAIFGALGLGDIGDFFPNTDPAWKDAPSARFLETARLEMEARDYQIGNVDLTVLAELPKLSPYKLAIRTEIARLLGVPADDIGLKATTLEKLGALGRGEGLMAQAVVLLKPREAPLPEKKLTKAQMRKVIERDLASKPDQAAPAGTLEAVVPTDGAGLIRAWTDGASRGNPGPASIGVLITDADGLVIHQAKHVIGTATNNVAEYRAMLYALQVAVALNPAALEVNMDSELVVKQMRGEYRVKDVNLAKLHAEGKTLAAQLPKVTFRHVRREENTAADALANAALDEQ